MERCAWCEGFDAYRQYHDLEWGVPLRDPLALFELLMLEGAQAGLSWATILKKRDNYRRAFDGFDPEKIARYDERKMAQLLADPGIGFTVTKQMGTSPQRNKAVRLPFAMCSAPLTVISPAQK